MDLSAVHRGLLYALVARLPDGFMTSGGFMRVSEERFTSGYGAAMKSIAACPSESCPGADVAAVAAQEALDSYGGAFGMYQSAETMLLEGWRDMILSLESPRNEQLRWRIGFGAAERELSDLCLTQQLDVGLFRGAAESFAGEVGRR